MLSRALWLPSQRVWCGLQVSAGQADAAQECHICMDAFCRGTRIMSLPCDHCFCSGCIRRCVRKSCFFTLSHCPSPPLPGD